MLDILKKWNYNPPNFKLTVDKTTKKLGPTGYKKPLEIIKNDNCYNLYVNGIQWMMYEIDNHHQASQLFSHYYISSGNVIATGLGFGIRELWLLNNPNIKSLTILENNKDIIEYHKEVNPILFEKAKIINCDARTYKGKCDTLLLDHYEFESMTNIIEDVKNITKNIKCRNLWFWHLETQILADLHKVDEHNLTNRFRQGEFKINIETLNNIKIVYENIKLNYGLKLPDLSKEELQLIITIYTHFFQKM